jgi:hypothetical protein
MFAGGGKRDGLTVDRRPGTLVKKMAFIDAEAVY